MILSKSRNFKAFICALVCALIVLSPTFSAPQRVEASAGAIAIVATVGVLAIGLSYLYGSGLASRVVEKCKQSDFAQYVVNIGNIAIQYGTGVGLYSVAQRTVNDLIKKGVSSSTISATTDPVQAMSLLTNNNVAVKPTSSEITAIVNSIPANVHVENPSYAPRSNIFKSFNYKDYEAWYQSKTSLYDVINVFDDLAKRLSDFSYVRPFSSANPFPSILCATRSITGSLLYYSSGSGYFDFSRNYYSQIETDDPEIRLIYPKYFINGVAYSTLYNTYYPCHIDVLTGDCTLFSDSSLFVSSVCFSFGYRGYGFSDRSTFRDGNLANVYRLYGSFVAFNEGRCFGSSGYYKVSFDSALSDVVHVKGSDIEKVFGGLTDIYTETPTLNINKVVLGTVQPDVDIKLNEQDKGDNVYLPIVPSVAVDGFSVPTDTVVDNIPVTVPSEVIDNIDVSVDDYVTDNPTDVNVVVDTSGIVTSIDYVTQAIEDSNYHKGFTVPSFNIDVPQYDSNFLSRWGKWIEFTRGVFNGFSGTELGGIVITSALIMVAVSVFRKVL